PRCPPSKSQAASARSRWHSLLPTPVFNPPPSPGCGQCRNTIAQSHSDMPHPLSRRALLKAAGVTLALPLLDSMQPPAARADQQQADSKPRRFFGICNNLGLLPDLFVPTGSGSDYRPSPYLELLQAHRRDFSVFSGVSHPNVDGGHPADVCFLTAAPHPGSSSFRNTISLDQQIAEHIGTLTRFPSITLGVNTRIRSLSSTGTGVAIPPEDNAAEVFKQ